jgi:hypothetical protein
MEDQRFTLRTWFMALMAFAIIILFIMGSTALWRRNLRETILFFALGATLALFFYRGRLAVLATLGCAFVVVNAGLTAVFHPSVLGIAITVASILGLIFFSFRVGKQHPNLSPDDWQKVFDRK